MSAGVIPSKSSPTIYGPGLVDGDVVEHAKCIDEVAGIVHAGVFDAEIVDH